MNLVSGFGRGGRGPCPQNVRSQPLPSWIKQRRTQNGPHAECTKICH